MESALRELYQQVIIDHGKNPRNFSESADANRIKEGFNPLCGDKLKLFLHEDNGVVTKATFTGCGCAISMASASLMTDMLVGKTTQQVEALFNAFHDLVTGSGDDSPELLGKLTVLAGVAEYPARVKCATLAWHTALAAVQQSKESVSTE